MKLMNSAQFAAQLENATQEQQAKTILHRYLASYGFRHYAFTYYSGHVKTGRKLRYHCVSEGLYPWHLYYLEQGYADADRTLEESHTMILPLPWDLQTQAAEAKNNREHRIRIESMEFGIDKGLSIPVHGPNNDFAVLLLHQFQNETCLENYQTHQFEWQSSALIFYHNIRKLLNLNSETVAPYRLTAREEQCLLFTAKSWRVEQIAKELKISPRTVNFHIQNANKKLGTNNKYQAVNKIMAY